MASSPADNMLPLRNLLSWTSTVNFVLSTTVFPASISPLNLDYSF